MTIKMLLKAILPSGLTYFIGYTMMRFRERQLQHLSLRDAFNKIYRDEMWKQGNSMSGVGSEGLLAFQYVTFILKYIDDHNIKSIVDGGCGDFEIGSKLFHRVSKYTALDVSSHVIDENKKRYVENETLSFRVADMTTTIFPPADLILIRQVLQHLTNAQIEAILKNIEISRWRRVLITEEVADPKNDAAANLDLPYHTVRTRVSKGSGVFIDCPPFNREAKRILVIKDSLKGMKEHSPLVIFELSSPQEKTDSGVFAPVP
jgi:hypothetical protein